jgi:hypothetical protein
MFTKPKPNIVESDEGFSLETLGQVGLKYTQGGKTLFIDSEMLVGDFHIIVYANRIEKWDSGESIDEETKKIIMNNTNRVLLFLGVNAYIQW